MLARKPITLSNYNIKRKSAQNIIQEKDKYMNNELTDRLGTFFFNRYDSY